MRIRAIAVLMTIALPLVAAKPPAGGFRATSELDLSVGGYTLRMDCNAATSGCIPPAITSEPIDQQVPLGQSARVTVGATGVGGIKYSWYDLSFGLPTQLSAFDASITLPAINKPVVLQARADTPCGFALSRIARINPIARARAVRH